MVNQGETFFITVGCMDGRCQEVVAKFGREKFRAEYPDTITEAGLVGRCSKEPVDGNLLESLRFKIATVSLGKHVSKGIVVYGHQECAGNPVDDNLHKDHIRKTIQLVRSIVQNKVPVIGVFVKRSSVDSSRWEVEEIPLHAAYAKL